MLDASGGKSCCTCGTELAVQLVWQLCPAHTLAFGFLAPHTISTSAEAHCCCVRCCNSAGLWPHPSSVTPGGSLAFSSSAMVLAGGAGGYLATIMFATCRCEE